MSIQELLNNKTERTYKTTLIYRGCTGESILIYEGQRITERDLDERFPVDGMVGDIAYKENNADGTHIK